MPCICSFCPHSWLGYGPASLALVCAPHPWPLFVPPIPGPSPHMVGGREISNSNYLFLVSSLKIF